MEHNITLIDREEETAFLEEAYAANKSQLIILYGRRRVGKTFLLQQFMSNKKHAYCLCTKGNENEQIRLLSLMIGERFNDTALMLSPFSEWRSLFIHRDKPTDDRKTVEIDIVALDEIGNGIIFAECKWQDLNQKNAEKLLAALKEKSKHVEWKAGNTQKPESKRQEYFAIFARRIEGKDVVRKSGFFAWDLDDYRDV